MTEWGEKLHCKMASLQEEMWGGDIRLVQERSLRDSEGLKYLRWRARTKLTLAMVLLSPTFTVNLKIGNLI